jgi:hypothetical protein
LVVRVPVEISFEGNVVRTSAILNTGYESDEPEIHIPIALAGRLGVRVEGVRSERYKVLTPYPHPKRPSLILGLPERFVGFPARKRTPHPHIGSPS